MVQKRSRAEKRNLRGLSLQDELRMMQSKMKILQKDYALRRVRLIISLSKIHLAVVGFMLFARFMLLMYAHSQFITSKVFAALKDLEDTARKLTIM